MNQRRATAITIGVLAAVAAHAQHAPVPPSAPPAAQDPSTGRGRGGPPVQGAEEDLPLVAKFDRNADKRLDYAERAAAREYLVANPGVRRPLPQPRITKAGSTGLTLSPKDVTPFDEKTSLYDPGTVRTLFLEFERPDWEQELAAFYHTDVEIPATLVVDGRRHRDVGVSFRGNNSFTAVPDGLKRPLTLKLDFVHEDQHLLGYRSLQLLNSNQDPTFLRTLLFLDVARDYIPAQRANFVRVAINGESWGIYVNQQAFNKDFLRDAFKTTEGRRFKSPNNSTGGGLSYLGEDAAPYRRWYEIKSKDDAASWAALIRLCKVLNDTPLDQLEQALEPLMDVDAVLKYLALDVALVNGDGYWRDGSDFNLYQDPRGRFHLVPHDVNEGFRAGGRGGGASPDPLVALDDPNKALRTRLLAVPALRTRYLAYMGDIAEKWLDWRRLGPLVERYHTLIAQDVARDTRKLDSTEAFTAGVYGQPGEAAPSAATIKGFADQRRAALLAHPEIVKARQR
jgi:hypothetical protein